MALPVGQFDKQIWDNLINWGCTEECTAGIMGNLYAESGLQPNNVQNSSGYSDEYYTSAVDSGSYSEYTFVHDSIGYGLAQWTYYSRKQKLYNLTVAVGKSIANYNAQMYLLQQELESYGINKDSTSIRETSDWILHEFESPADQSESVEIVRYNYSVEFYERYTGSSPEPPEPPEPPVKKQKKNNFFMFMLKNRIV